MNKQHLAIAVIIFSAIVSGVLLFILFANRHAIYDQLVGHEQERQWSQEEWEIEFNLLPLNDRRRYVLRNFWNDDDLIEQVEHGFITEINHDLGRGILLRDIRVRDLAELSEVTAIIMYYFPHVLDPREEIWHEIGSNAMVDLRSVTQTLERVRFTNTDDGTHFSGFLNGRYFRNYIDGGLIR